MSSRALPVAPDRTCAGLLPEIAGQETRRLLRDEGSAQWLNVGELRQMALDLARTIASPSKQLVFLLAGNTTSSIVGLLGAAAAGHAVALIDPTLAQERLGQLIAAYGPEIVLSSGSLEDIECLSSWRSVAGSLLSPHIAFQTKAGSEPEIAPELLLLLSTSGTTGSAKFVRLGRSAVLANANQIADALGIDAQSVGIAHLPLHYSYGLSVVTSHLLAGGRLALIDDAVTSPSFWENVGASGGTHFPGVPFHYNVLARLGLSRIPETVNTFTQAGGALPQRVFSHILEQTTERRARFFVMYGQTEASPRMTTLPYDRAEEKSGSVGVALAGGRISIVGPDNEPVTAGQLGRVVYQGPNVMMGYAETRDQLSLGDLLRGRLETGDIGRLDDDGYLFLSGRTNRFAKIAGLRLGLDDIEAELSDLGAVACLDGGDKVLVACEAESGAALKPRLKALAQEYRIPATSFRHCPVAKLPRSVSGKTDYARLKEMLIDV